MKKITKHASSRVGERSIFDLEAIEVLNEYAYRKGYPATAFKGPLGKYLSDKIRDNHTLVKVYLGYVFIYYDSVLITLYKIAPDLEDDYNAQMKLKSGKNSVHYKNLRYLPGIDPLPEKTKGEIESICEKADELDDLKNLIAISNLDNMIELRKFVEELKSKVEGYDFMKRIIEECFKEHYKDYINLEDKLKEGE